MMKSTSSRLELSHYSSSKKEHLWASRFGITWENRSANHITNAATVSTFNDCHESNTGKKNEWNQGLWLQRKGLGKVASLIRFGSGNNSTTNINSISCLLLISHLNTLFLHFVHFHLEAFYGNSLFSKKDFWFDPASIWCWRQKFRLMNLGLVKCVWEEELIYM